LLFIVGLSLNPTVIREVGRVSLVTGIGQVVFTSVIGFLIAIFLGIDRIAALYISIALTFSSTIIILKLLSDKGDLNKLYGRISIGFLLVQDIIATIILIFVSTLGSSSEENLMTTIGFILAKGLGVGILLYLISGYVLPKLSKFIASSQELLFLFSITWGLGLSAVFYLLGFSIEIGALVAGVTLSLTPFAYEISSRLKPLRDFFIVMFFILLGSQMVLDTIPQILFPATILSLFVLIGNPIIVIILMNILGYKRKTGFLAGLAVAQISEFSLILAALGFNIGHLDKQALSLVTLVGLITIAGSTYFIIYADTIYSKIESILKLLEIRKGKKPEATSQDALHDLILFGYDRGGQDFINAFNKLDKDYLVVDFNPQTIQKLQNAGLPYRYGDAEDAEFLQELEFSNVKLVVTTLPDYKTNLLLLRRIRQVNTKAIVIIFSHEVEQAIELYENGATYVVMPHYLGTRHLANMIERIELDRKEFEEERQKHLEHLEKKIRQSQKNSLIS
jgi:Kef-type K+ transport system membrane component KefB/Trk K+ transport system NAD-binding subunit